MKKLILLLAAVVCLSSGFAPAVNALSFSISIGDQPYYLHGPGYWAGGVYYIWVPGHWQIYHHQRVWVHGHYRVR